LRQLEDMDYKAIVNPGVICVRVHTLPYLILIKQVQYIFVMTHVLSFATDK